MKAMILAAGLGTRMRPLTDTCPKPLLKAAGKPLIDYHLERLAEAGVSDVVVNASWLAEQLQDYLGDGSRYGLSLHLSREAEPLETAGGIVQALPLLGEEPFLLVNGDVWTDYPFAQLLTATTAAQAGGAHLVLIDNPPHHPEGDFLLRDGLIGESDDSGEGTRLTYSGISVWHPRCFADLDPGRRALKPIMLAAMARGQLSGEYFAGRWWDIGTPQRLAQLDTLLRDKAAGALG